MKLTAPTTCLIAPKRLSPKIEMEDGPGDGGEPVIDGRDLKQQMRALTGGTCRIRSRSHSWIGVERPDNAAGQGCVCHGNGLKPVMVDGGEQMQIVDYVDQIARTGARQSGGGYRAKGRAKRPYLTQIDPATRRRKHNGMVGEQ